MADEIVVEPEVNPVDPAPADPAPAPADPAPVDPAPADPAPVDPAPADPAPGEPITEDIIIEGLTYGDHTVNVTIPPDMANFASEKGIDIEAVAKEVYSKDGLTDATKQTLYDAMGKWQVDAYLDGLKAKDQANLDSALATAEQQTKAQEEAWDETMTIMGGEDRWNDLDAFALSTLSEAEIAEFNAVMENGSLYMQKLMIADLWGKYAAAGAPAAPVQLDLETGDNIPAGDAKGAITSEEYMAAFTSGDYHKDPAAWDARRQAGIQKGL